MSMMKEISDALLCVKMGVFAFLIAGVAVGVAAGFLSSSVWIGAGLAIIAGVVAGYFVSQLPWHYY